MLYNEKVPYVIRYSDPLGYVEVIWNGSLTVEQLNTGLDQLLNVLKAKQAKLLLVDISNFSSTGPEAQAWVKDFYLQGLQNHSIERIARVVDPHAFGQALLNNMLLLLQSQSSFSFCLSNFTDRGEALEWLLREVPA
ncbi:STAS/SEC14 domain-containing protein [Pontibacter ruber]|uniref:STAS/SEC14 domain-containing protein n=1 Tax=Pontibacter ruber TaxID=1343895 RepID=A0ABW5CV91_9BACT|nr:STAS/SEC14 domain-containing protein [Pontibacter ruber]